MDKIIVKIWFVILIRYLTEKVIVGGFRNNRYNRILFSSEARHRFAPLLAASIVVGFTQQASMESSIFRGTLQQTKRHKIKPIWRKMLHQISSEANRLVFFKRANISSSLHNLFRSAQTHSQPSREYSWRCSHFV